MPVLRVALDVPVTELFDYDDPQGSPSDRGCLAIVPFGRGTRTGVVIGSAETSVLATGRLKRPHRVLRDRPPVPEEVLKLLEFCSSYYVHPLGQTVVAALPTALRSPAGRWSDVPIAYVLTEEGRRQDPGGFKRSPARRALLAALTEGPPRALDELSAAVPSAGRILGEWRRLGWVSETPAEMPRRRGADVRPSAVEDPPAAALPELTAAQSKAVEEIATVLGRFEVVLLHGVTGSGKTEVYLRAMASALESGGQALLLVPEINLTPQLEARVASRFGAGNVVSLHSSLAEGERLARWERARDGEARIVIGTRLAVFTPMPRLALVVVDEEHDGSFKQQEGLRYQGRDVAVVRARNLGIPAVLGSATPSLESWHNARSGRYKVVTLPDRAASQPPSIELVDIHGMTLDEGLAAPCAERIGAAVAIGEQALVFLNRRGFAPALFCHACGWSAPCHRCSARLTFHMAARRLRCHYCGHEEAVVRACPSCGNQDLLPVGAGTERVERMLGRRFPAARITRVDRDTTRRKGAFAAVRRQVADREIDILVGTQMLAKGHDFPGLSVVVVLGADNALFSADFRAEERLFALLLQVAGRAGRGRVPGRVLVQTSLPRHPLYQSLVTQDYAAFASGQLELREKTEFPPFTHQAVLRAEAADEASVFGFLEEAGRAARAIESSATIHDPAPALIPRVAGKWRGHVLVQSHSRQELRALLRGWVPGLESSRVRWSLDVDPAEI